MLALIGLVAFAQVGIELSSSGASGRSEHRFRATALDQARSSMPLPRVVPLAPVQPTEVEADARLAAARRAADRADRAARAISSAGVWSALARCESGADPRAKSADGRYFGAFQFSLATWESLGYGGNPTDHAYEVQLDAARRLQARSGWSQWPRCARRLALV